MEDRGLERIETEVTADHLVVILRLRSVRPHDHEPLMHRWIVGHDHSAVARTAKILAREEAETTDRPNASRLSVLYRLRRWPGQRLR